ncbi:Tox-REase-5 domain-containing protein [Myxococcus llanfairpwllgwyngyllgogerychwyrndrobwllllantysiliogogogochensis]|uniref:Tox-REase-5 domain-containing protein n=1 Tax=Myxococcus llanfairpwllgwyngyllgogerychwyrndrobwllllantysiliogogogochensis TaxID=2590453 RepID=UPI001FE8B22F|nr:Tox-REase-5 domain-containing protein [Myxococcus llanfairpwllgwyngyllgogerychwyrndrobwllllantysiliogogogochensis]
MAGDSLTATQAARLLEVLLGKDVTLGQFPARVAVGFMLREVLDAGEVSRAELVRRVGRFTHLAVLRPDGCLAWVRSGQTQQRVGAVEWKDGTFRAGQFELGVFYSGKGGVFRQLNARLEETGGGAFADVHDDADYVSRTLDGAEEAFVGLAMAVGQLFSTSPTDNLAALRQMPAAVAALLASSPEYLEHFQYLTRGEQVQSVSKLVTNLIATWGTASAATRTLKGATLASAEVPVLSLSAEGALVMRRVAVPVGRAAAVLSGGPGAAIILQRAGTGANHGGPPKGPGRWRPTKEHMEEPARRYQAQITSAPEGQVYDIDNVKFDGFNGASLLEAKGPGYEKFLEQAVEQGGWFEGFMGMIKQARSQQRVSRGLPIEWHFAESRVADYVRVLFRRNGLGRISVVHTPPNRGVR